LKSFAFWQAHAFCKADCSEKPNFWRNKKWWLRPELNWRHADFQSAALPTELLSHTDTRRLLARVGDLIRHSPPLWQHSSEGLAQLFFFAGAAGAIFARHTIAAGKPMLQIKIPATGRAEWRYLRICGFFAHRARGGTGDHA
jgi:hypothetical protein